MPLCLCLCLSGRVELCEPLLCLSSTAAAGTQRNAAPGGIARIRLWQRRPGN